MAILESLAGLTRLRDLKYESGYTPLDFQELPTPEGQGHSVNQINARTTDLVRIGRLLTSPAGLRFGANQALLAQGDLTALANGAPIGNVKERIVSTLKGVGEGAVSVLAQVPVNGTGVHFINSAAPTYLVPETQGGGTAFGNFLRDALGPGANGVEGAPIVLGGGIVPDRGIPTQLTDGEAALNPKLGEAIEGLPDGTAGLLEATGLGNFSDIEELSNGLATVEKGQIQQIGRELNLNPTTEGVAGTDDNSKFIDGEAVSREIKSRRLYRNAEGDIVEGELTTTPELNGIHNNPFGPDDDSYRKSTESRNLFARIGTVDSGAEGTKVDVVNEQMPESDYLADFADENQIIPFIFQPYSVGYQQTLYFRAYLDSFNDNFTGNWGETQYIGRGDKYYTYQGFDRDVNFSFKVAASSKAELEPLYRKLNYLAGSTAPTYQDGLFMRGTLVQLTIGDYLKGQHGYISTVGLSWQVNYPWEIGRDEDGNLEAGTIRVPHVLDVDIAFKPIHDFPARFNTPSKTWFGFGEPYGGKTT